MFYWLTIVKSIFKVTMRLLSKETNNDNINVKDGQVMPEDSLNDSEENIDISKTTVDYDSDDDYDYDLILVIIPSKKVF